jgi:hypothetical protein
LVDSCHHFCLSVRLHIRICFYCAQGALTPVETAMAWLHAIDSDNVTAARNLFVPSRRQQIAWMESTSLRFVDVLEPSLRIGVCIRQRGGGSLHLQGVGVTD